MTMRCLADGRFMRRLARDGHWWMCTGGCMELRSSDPDVEVGWQLLGAFDRGFRSRSETRARR